MRPDSDILVPSRSQSVRARFLSFPSPIDTQQRGLATRLLSNLSRIRAVLVGALLALFAVNPQANAFEKAVPTASAAASNEREHANQQVARTGSNGAWRTRALEASSTRFAEGFSEITAAAVSPLLVVSSIGALRYVRTPESERHNLPWFCTPVAWGLGLTLLLLCLLKDVFGALLPTPLKKPLDMLELFENKLSALVASTLFVPVVISQICDSWGPSSAFAPPPAEVHWAQAFRIEWLDTELRWLVVASGMFCFFSVWVLAHMVNVLIALCPFAVIDSLLKGCKSAVLAMILGASAIHPFLGSAFCGLLLLLSLSMLGYAFRFAIFGMFTALDVLLFWSPRRGADPLEALAFSAAGTTGAPVRTYGRVRRGASGNLFFEYRPWMILPRRSVELPKGRLLLRKGLLSVALLIEDSESADGSPAAPPLAVLEFLPRYRRHTDALAEQYQIGEVREGALVGGIKALWQGVLQMKRPQVRPRRT
jgi:hypothetical protein